MMTAKLVRGLSDVATTNVCKVDTSNRNHIERSSGEHIINIIQIFVNLLGYHV